MISLPIHVTEILSAAVPTRASQRKPRAAVGGDGGFTLIELLVVIAIIAILAALLLPVLAKAKADGQSAVCTSNHKQLAVAWLMYAGDYKDYLVNNYSDGNADCGSQAWVTSGSILGVGTWTGNPRNDTNDFAITKGLLWVYNGNAGIYHCPTDQSMTDQPNQVIRNRSYSMSIGMNWLDESSAVDATNGTFVKMNAMVLPTPTKASVFIDEAAYSIDNNVLGIYPPQLDPTGAFLVPGTSTGFWNLPTSRHNNGCNLSFADGHAEHWKWLGQAIIQDNAVSDSEAQNSVSGPAQGAGFFPCPANDPDLDKLELTVPVFNP
jgi:prepilin-type N-terminal cleavage/methylation domain-containing protein/prepilin-type processing-associated H-X9-DG protein